MTFYYMEEENVLEGNQLGEFTEVDGTTVTIDVDGIMEEGRGTRKLNEMVNQIEEAIEANQERESEGEDEGDSGGDN